MSFTKDIDMHEMGAGSYNDLTKEIEVHCLTCKALIRGVARHGHKGAVAIEDVMQQHSILTNMPPQLGVTPRTTPKGP